MLALIAGWWWSSPPTASPELEVPPAGAEALMAPAAPMEGGAALEGPTEALPEREPEPELESEAPRPTPAPVEATLTASERREASPPTSPPSDAVAQPVSPSPAPPAEASAAPEAAPEEPALGAIYVSGDIDSAWLVRAGTRYKLGRVAPGDYELFVSYAGEEAGVARTVTVPAGGSLSLRCTAALRRCMVE